MKKNLINVIIVLVIGIVAAAITFMFIRNSKPKVVFVKSDNLFNEFELTKELNAKYENVHNAKNVILDSLIMNIKVASIKGSPILQSLEKEYYVKKETFEKEDQALMDQYNQQVWARINQYTSDYAKKKGFDMVLGANGSGSLFYANDKLDISAEVITYMNEQYAGQK